MRREPRGARGQPTIAKGLIAVVVAGVLLALGLLVAVLRIGGSIWG